MNITEGPFIDIIMPNYNKAEFISEAVDSVVKQSYKNWYLYIIDGGSTDLSLQKLSKFSKIKNIRIISFKRNKGPGFSRNYGMRISNSKYISFLDSDDGWSSDKLEKQLNLMRKNQYNFTYTDYTPFFQNKGKKIFKPKTNLKSNLNFSEFIKNTSINTSTMIIERSIVKTHKFKKVKLEDYLFKCDILKNNITAHKYNESLAFYRILKVSRSSQKIKNVRSVWQINKKYNKLNFIQNLISVFSIAINSIKKYGIK